MLRLSTLACLTLCLTAHAQYEGYGYGAVGGTQEYRVTSLDDSGPGTLRDAVHQTNGTNRRVVFDTAGTIVLLSDITVRGHNLTIDGSTAPAPGITVSKTSISDGEFIITGTHDVIVTHLRFCGLWQTGGVHANNAATITIDGDSGPDHVARNIVLDHISTGYATDGGPDIWGEVQDITVSYCFVYRNWHPTTVSHYPAPYQTRQRITMHHNVYAQNGERNPQIRADVQHFNYVNNIVYDWGYYGEGGGYGVRIKNVPGEPQVNGNFLSNAFVPTIRPSWALVYGVSPGDDAEDSAMGQLCVYENYFPPENLDDYSTIRGQLPVPPEAEVTTHEVCALSTLLYDSVGMQYRDATETAILDALKADVDAVVAPCPVAGVAAHSSLRPAQKWAGGSVRVGIDGRVVAPNARGSVRGVVVERRDGRDATVLVLPD